MSDRKRYAFWPQNGQRYSVLSPGITVFRWTFYELPADFVESCSVPHEAVPRDESKAGTRLKKWFRRFGFKPGNCNCESIAKMMDEAGLSFLENHVDDLVDLIAQSAAQMQITAPKPLLRRLVRLALWSERRCLRT